MSSFAEKPFVRGVVAWCLAARPKTLPAALAPIMMATGLAHLHGSSIQWIRVLLLGLSILFLQVATNFFNDAIDFKKGADQDRIGPQRVTQAGIFNEAVVHRMAWFFCGLTVVVSLPLVAWGGWPIFILGIFSLFLTYGYTGGPYPLAYLGLGDLFVILFFGLIAVGGSYFILTGNYNLEVFLLGLQSGFLSTVLLSINNLRDSDRDKKVNKKTLAVRWGDGFAKIEITLFLLIPVLLSVYWAMAQNNFLFLLILILLPLSLKIVINIFKVKDKRELNSALALAGLHLLLYAVLFTVVSLLSY